MHIGVQDFDIPRDGAVRADRNGGLAVNVRSVADDGVGADLQGGRVVWVLPDHANSNMMSEFDPVAQLDLGKPLADFQIGTGEHRPLVAELGCMAHRAKPTESGRALLHPRRVPQGGQNGCRGGGHWRGSL